MASKKTKWFIRIWENLAGNRFCEYVKEADVHRPKHLNMHDPVTGKWIYGQIQYIIVNVQPWTAKLKYNGVYSSSSYHASSWTIISCSDTRLEGLRVRSKEEVLLNAISSNRVQHGLISGTYTFKQHSGRLQIKET